MSVRNPLHHEPVITVSSALAASAWINQWLTGQQIDGATLVNWRSFAIACAVAFVREKVTSPATRARIEDDVKAEVLNELAQLGRKRDAVVAQDAAVDAA